MDKLEILAALVGGLIVLCIMLLGLVVCDHSNIKFYKKYIKKLEERVKIYEDYLDSKGGF